MSVVKEHPYREFLHQVAKPARYLGGEYNAILKDWSSMTGHLALCFPDVYDIGMSHLGTKILYHIVNREPDLCAERVFCPWPDMEAELRQRNLTLLSLENHRPLCEFDIVGFSLQYELTFSNILTMLELGGIPLRAKLRTLADPLVIAGGPVATHAEALAPFIDAFVIGDGEEILLRLMRRYTELKKAGDLGRTELLIELAKEGGLYCPALYERELCEHSRMFYISRAIRDDVPISISRAVVDDLNRYPFPENSPVAVAEAIFDRMAIEIARGCTEGCRFCQAGMIYRPVRERDPQKVIDTVMGALEQGGYNEAAITALSTADYSCIHPLISKLMQQLREHKIGLGISSLRAYGLDEDLLDQISSVKATGLTFAPEAGSQRMREVINKNIDQEDIFTSCHRVFSRGWQKIKLYFMIGLPTEQDEDVIGIAKIGRQAVEIGRMYKKKSEVVVSVSNHVPKPHTPFQWCAMNSPNSLINKQDILRNLAKKWGFVLRYHSMRISRLEAIFARGDIRMAELLEKAWRKGVRFDSWDDLLRWDLWQEAIAEWEAEQGIDLQLFLQDVPTQARLPWDHIDVGVEREFLLREYHRAMSGQLSPPCGKPLSAKLQHTNLADALADQRTLICYHCGIACDLQQMREKRIDFLKQLGAESKADPQYRLTAYEGAMQRFKRGLTPHDFQQGQRQRYRLRFTKLSPINLQGHQDMLRIIPQITRRAQLKIFYSEGFRPKPMLSFGPALALGIQSLAEYADISLCSEYPVEEIISLLNTHSPSGLYFTGVRKLDPQDQGLSKILRITEYLAILSPKLLAQIALPIPTLETQTDDNIPLNWHNPIALQQHYTDIIHREQFAITIQRKLRDYHIELRSQVLDLTITNTQHIPIIAGFDPSHLALRIRIKESDGPTIRPGEVIDAIYGISVPLHQIIRSACWAIDDQDQLRDPLLFSKTTSTPICAEQHIPNTNN
jgi:radical SAM family uncharacterized protein/radical SAM-linked protein